MRPLHVRYRHDIYCPYLDCGRRVCAEGDMSAAVRSDGSAVTLPGFNPLEPHVFEVSCAANHVIPLHFPKDIMLVKTPDVEGENSCPPAVLRL